MKLPNNAPEPQGPAWLFSEEGYPLNQQIGPASRGVPRVADLEVVGLLHEMMVRLVTDFGFEHVKMAGEAHLNRTTEPVIHFLVWLERTPEAQAALRLALQRLTGKPPSASRVRSDFP
jgi:hypothetical protein